MWLSVYHPICRRFFLFISVFLSASQKVYFEICVWILDVYTQLWFIFRVKQTNKFLQALIFKENWGTDCEASGNWTHFLIPFLGAFFFFFPLFSSAQQNNLRVIYYITSCFLSLRSPCPLFLHFQYQFQFILKFKTERNITISTSFDRRYG